MTNVTGSIISGENTTKINSKFLGFDQTEVNFITNIARFHQKRAQNKRDPEILELDSRERETLRILTTFIRLGESLDRSHAALIQHVRFSRSDEESVFLEVVARGDCQLEIWGVEAEKKAFEKIFGKNWFLRESRREVDSDTRNPSSWNRRREKCFILLGKQETYIRSVCVGSVFGFN